METIHLKSVDPVAQALLRQAATEGRDLAWDRFEAQQPQDGFVRTGLSCAFGCMQGPCRIDPFGRGAKQGICGIDRDEMVAAQMLRLCVNGALEAGIAGDDVIAGAAMLRRPSAGAEAMLELALSLALSVAGAASDGASGSFELNAGYGALAANGPVLGVAGLIDTNLAGALAASDAITAVSLGSWIQTGSGLLPFACTSGEAELALISKRVHGLLAGAGTDGALIALAEKLGIAVIAADSADGVIAATQKAAASASSGVIDVNAAQSGAATACFGADAVAGALKGKGQWAIIGGPDTPHQSLGWIATEVPPALMAEDLNVAVFGDAALWATKAGLAGGDHGSPATVLGPNAGVVEAVKAAGPDNIRGVCFTALADARDVALALGIAAMGVDVMVATPLPIWGSQTVMASLDAMLDARGGAIGHVDKPADADAVLAWFEG